MANTEYCKTPFRHVTTNIKANTKAHTAVLRRTLQYQCRYQYQIEYHTGEYWRPIPPGRHVVIIPPGEQGSLPSSVSLSAGYVIVRLPPPYLRRRRHVSHDIARRRHAVIAASSTIINNDYRRYREWGHNTSHNADIDITSASLKVAWSSSPVLNTTNNIGPMPANFFVIINRFHAGHYSVHQYNVANTTSTSPSLGSVFWVWLIELGYASPRHQYYRHAYTTTVNDINTLI